MLRVTINKKRGTHNYYVDFTADTFPNRGGYFCEVYDDAEKEFKIDEFTIDKRQLAGAIDDKARIKRAMLIASVKVRDMF